MPDILMELGFHMPSKCAFCENVEDLDHLFADCAAAREVWSYFQHRLNVLRGSMEGLWAVAIADMLGIVEMA